MPGPGQVGHRAVVLRMPSTVRFGQCCGRPAQAGRAQLARVLISAVTRRPSPAGRRTRARACPGTPCSPAPVGGRYRRSPRRGRRVRPRPHPPRAWPSRFGAESLCRRRYHSAGMRSRAPGNDIWRPSSVRREPIGSGETTATRWTAERHRRSPAMRQQPFRNENVKERQFNNFPAS